MSSRPGRWSYGAWHDGPDPLAAPFDLRAVVDEVGERVLAGENLRDVLDELRRSGTGRTPGTDALRRQLARRRRELQRRGNLGGVLDQVRAALDQAVAAEREALAGDGTDAARLAEMELDTLPGSTAADVRALADYSWRSEEARRTYEQIKEMLREQVLDQQFAGLKQALSGQDPAGSQQLRDMLADLNSLLAAHSKGQDTTEQFAEFMDRHGEFFPEGPADTDELVDLLARRQADAERMMRSLSREQRAELADLMQQAMGDADLASQLGQLRDNLTALRPGMMRGRGFDVDGEEGLGYGEAVGVVSDLADVEDLQAQLGQDYAGAGLDDVDVEAIERQLGGEAVRDLEQLRRMERELERQGWLQRGDSGLSLSPKALRRLGETTLKRIFASLDAPGTGSHDDRRTGAADERTGAYLPWELGGDQPVDAVRSVVNAIARRAAEAGTPTARDGATGSRLEVHDRDGSGRTPPPDGVRSGGAVPAAGFTLEAEDFVVAETERRTSAAVALCVDLSFSMIQADRWGPMKQTSLALAHLVATRFRSDALQIIGFDLMARRLSPLELAGVEPAWVQGTNLAHALSLAGRHLHRHPDAEPVVLVVTDGEPTAHLQPDGTPYFSWPPERETLRATLQQVDRLTRARATLNFFRLGDDPGLERFLDAVARRAGGRVFAPQAGRLGEYVVRDYLRTRGGRRGR
ncbi:vWA domain-containing protein [Auraticoccus monumenti]|uniref:Uncharacterized protein, contains von Willebrand factor type A (VWA) domain n=1 Tax=Auraticoccus monumenti TaxID=675864 RepID=A0A1G6UC28_9ACTN|nr:hypothetical protein [Auraticoccus monumenti]SDD38863.1 Uncharacterized protein, contains von Willebrand factor type A (vWA) domain [Auraticoccus monumenti]